MDSLGVDTLVTGLSAATLISLGIAYGDIRARLSRIEKSIFNGQFISKEELDIRVSKSEDEHSEIRRRLEKLEEN